LKVNGNDNNRRSNGTGRNRAAQPPVSRNAQPITAYAASSAGAGATGARTSTRPEAVSRQGRQVGATGRPIARPVSRGKKGIKVVLILLLILTLCAGGLAAGLVYYVSTVDTVFPNVVFEGHDLSGLTLGEATQRLIDVGYEDNAVGISARIVFPDDTSFTVTGPEVGLSLDARDAAFMVFNFGRDGSLIDNAMTYVRSRLESTELYYISAATIDDSIIRERAIVYTDTFNGTLLDSEMTVTENQITITKGTGFLPVEDNSVYDLAMFTLLRAIEENAHLTVNYIPLTYVDDSIDLLAMHREIHVEAISSMFVYGVLGDEDETETGSDGSDGSDGGNNGMGSNGSTVVIEDTGGLNDRTIVMGGTPSTIGRTFDLAEAEEMLLNAVGGETIVIPIYDVYPLYTQEQIDELVFRDTLGELTTRIGGSWERLQNVILASNLINETILLPGEVFDFNQTVGIRTRARGFHNAGAFLYGRLVDMPGGGICQVSSTIYATLLSTAIIGEEIEIVERRPHGLTISYLPFGQDAAIAWGAINLRFRNSFEFPIKIETIVDGRDMNVRIIGTRLDDYVIEVETVHISTTNFYTRDEETDELPYGERVLWTPGQPGQVVETFQRLYSADGELLRRVRVSRDVYNRQDRVTRVGTFVPDEPDYGDSPPGGQQPGPGGGPANEYPGDDWTDDAPGVGDNDDNE